MDSTSTDQRSPSQSPSASTSPPTFLDGVEKVLLRIILVSLVVLAGLLGFAAWHVRHGGAPAPAASNPPSIASTITVTVDFGDGARRQLSGLSATPGMTVLDAMALARQHPRPIQSTVNGTGERALLTAIDGVASEGPEVGITKARCWQFWINDQYGQTSIGVAALRPGDRVIWAYRPYESDPKPPAP